jgi:hypothetical protein
MQLRTGSTTPGTEWAGASLPSGVVLGGRRSGDLGRDVPYRRVPVLRPDRAASRGLTSRRASKVVPWAMGMTRSVASSAESSLSAILSAARLLRSAGVTSTMPIREFANPLSISRSNDLPRPVVPGVAEEEVATLRVFPRLLLGLAGEGLDRSPFSSRVRDGPSSTQPPRPPATGRPTATAPGGPGRRGVVGGGAAVRAGSARRAVCGTAGRAMAIDGCCASPAVNSRHPAGCCTGTRKRPTTNR